MNITQSSKVKKMTIGQAAQKYAKERNREKMFKLLDQCENKGLSLASDLPLVCCVNSVGIAAHRWAWDTLEDWQNS